jgi:PAS domain S-box-containing protein
MRGNTRDTDPAGPDIAAVQRLRELSVRLITIADTRLIFDEALAGVMELTRADRGDFQLFDRKSKTLSIAAHRHVGPRYLQYFGNAAATRAWITQRALQRRKRLIVADITIDPKWEAQRTIARSTGFRAVGALPLFERNSGIPVGVISALFRKPCRPCARDLFLVDFYVQQAAQVIALKMEVDRLRARAQSLQAAVDLLGLGLYAWDLQSNALKWDARTKAIWGLPADAVIDYHGWHSRVHPDDAARVDVAFARCRDAGSGRKYDIEYRVNGADGVERWVSTRGQTFSHNGGAVNFIGVACDITARKEAELRLRHREARLTSILLQLPLGLGLLDKNGDLLLSAGALGSLWNTLKPSIDASQTSEWLSYDEAGSPLKSKDYPAARALRGESAMQGTDFIHTADDGRKSWMRVRAAPFRDDDGGANGAIGILEDIEAAKQPEEALREKDELLRQFSEQSTSALWILDVGTRQVEYLSAAHKTILGQHRQPIHWLEAIHPEDRSRTSDKLERAVQGAVVVQEYRILRPDGTLRFIRESIFPIRDANGKVWRVGGIAHDITSNASQVYVVPDATTPERIMRPLQHAGYNVRVFTSKQFLDIADVLAPGCTILDIRGSEMSRSLDILRQLKWKRNHLPLIVIAGGGVDVTVMVQALRSGAVDWLEAPFPDRKLLDTVSSALATVQIFADDKRDVDFARASIANMSERERQVLEYLLAGLTNKEIARELGISPRTVELHRGNVMELLRARTLPEAVLMATAAGLQPARSSRRTTPQG